MRFEIRMFRIGAFKRPAGPVVAQFAHSRLDNGSNNSLQRQIPPIGKGRHNYSFVAVTSNRMAREVCQRKPFDIATSR